MAYKNKRIENPQTGQSIRFLQTAADTEGELLEMETTYRAGSREPVPHYHPYQEERFRVLHGELAVRIEGEVKIFRAGESIHIAVNTDHSMWNPSGRETMVNWIVTPALDTEYLLETGMGLAADGKTNKNGMPSILQVALIANRFRNVYRLSKPSYPIQRVLFTVLEPIARIAGYKATYEKYIR